VQMRRQVGQVSFNPPVFHSPSAGPLWSSRSRAWSDRPLGVSPNLAGARFGEEDVFSVGSPSKIPKLR